MRVRARQFIDDQEAAYLQLLIDDRDPEVKKAGLQRLCKLYRGGLRHKQQHKLKIFVVGLLHDQGSKVRRWALNTLALLGSTDDVVAIVETIKRDRMDPDILGAGVSALCALLSSEQAREELRKADLPLDDATLLAATQQSTHFANELRVKRINIDTAEDHVLRLSGVLLGLQKAPENLFSLSLQNSQVIGQLNKHPDMVVAQYSVWAICESPALGLKDLTIKLADIESQPPNVRRYFYQVLVADTPTAMNNIEGIVVGSEDRDHEARAGLALGLREVFFDGLEEIAVDWYEEEQDDNTRQRLLEHMAAQSDKSVGYSKIVLSVYRATGQNSLTKVRLEAAAKNTPLYREMQKISYEAEGYNLFGESVVPSPKQLRQNDDALSRASQAKILIVTALAKETAAVSASFDTSETFGVPSDPNIYELGTFTNGRKTRHVVLATSGMGKVNAATVTSNALRSLNQIEHIIFVGIAGGCPNHMIAAEHVRLGDIVLSGNAGIVEYDFVKETTEGREIRAHPQRPSAKTLGVVTSLEAQRLKGSRPWEAAIDAALVKLGGKYARPDEQLDVLHVAGVVTPHPIDADRVAGRPHIHLGGIATADTLQKSAASRDELRDRFKVRAIEMEASGSQTAAWSAGKQLFVVRGICDYCDEHKSDVWQEHAALVAAGYARALIEHMPDQWFDANR